MKEKMAVFGGGCFWCTEAVFNQIKGVYSVVPGYAGGFVDNPKYKDVAAGTTGHAEVVRVVYDPSMILYTDLLTVFFASHDPTTLNRQGHDIGDQYRSAIFYTTQEQQTQAKEYIQRLEKDRVYGSDKITTTVDQLDTFYEAEEYHRDYFKKNPHQAYCQIVIAPKIKKLQDRFVELLDE